MVGDTNGQRENEVMHRKVRMIRRLANKADQRVLRWFWEREKNG